MPVLRITIEGKNFMKDGEIFYFIGGNTPWNKWNDFGTEQFDDDWWDTHFAALKTAGLNSTKVWFVCDGGGAVKLDNEGMFADISPTFFPDCDKLFYLAKKHGLYIQAVMLSFDPFKDGRGNVHGDRWQAMLKSTAAIESLINGYIVPFIKLFKDNPYLWSINLLVEPDWIFEGSIFEDNNPYKGIIHWDNICEFFARAAAAIHKNTDEIFVTVGMAMIKYYSDAWKNHEGCGNWLRDDYLQSLADDNPKAYMDFYSIHHYEWMTQWFKKPYIQTPDGYFGESVKKPAVIDECPAVSEPGSTLAQDYIDAYVNGWGGVFPWSTPGVDSAGKLSHFIEGAAGFYGWWAEQK